MNLIVKGKIPRILVVKGEEEAHRIGFNIFDPLLVGGNIITREA